MSALTIETLEHMFVYLGCANIPTQHAMDGAIPLESIIGTRRDCAAVFTMSEIQRLDADWSTKAVWFSGESLGLGTVSNIHWSSMAKALHHHKSAMRLADYSFRMVSTTDSDGFVRMHYSELDRFGRFVKFPVRPLYTSELSLKSLFNPGWTMEFADSGMRVLSSDSDEVFESKRISFLAPFLCGVAQSIKTYWQVKARFDSVCPSLTLLTDPTGVKEFWKLRDVPEGRQRRSALMHWVDSHWRQQRNDPDVESFVRKHIRGESKIRQGQFEAEIIPSQSDLLANQSYRDERVFMKKMRNDRRKRVSRLMANKK